MRAMKDSGVEWIGELPADWDVIKNKYLLLNIYSGGTPKATNNDFYCEDNGVPFVSISDMSNVQYVYTTKKYLTEQGIEDKNLKILPKETILYSIYATIGAISELKVEATISQAILALNVNEKINKNFYKYNLISMKDYVHNETNGNTQFNLNAEKVRNFYFAFPPLHEQQRIADYLDKKCAEIDAIISKQHSIIEKLQEYKLSLITETVTKGLNADAEMKDSGIEWIGEIPKHWKIKKLKYITKSIGDGIHSTPSYDDNGNIFFVNGNNIGEDSLVLKESTSKINEEEYYRYKLPALNNNTILITLNGATYGKTSFYNQEKILLGKSAGYIILNESENKKFLRYYLQSYYSKQSMDLSLLGSTIQNLSLKTLRNFNIVYPSLNEQKDIVCFLDKKCMNIESIINKKNSIIEKLTEYKKSLIYEVVTGKKEV